MYDRCRRAFFPFVVALALLLPASIARAQDNGAADTDPADVQQQDPPSRVGNLGYIDGDVSQYGDGDSDWTPAQLNHPVTSNMAFGTGADGRAELQLDSAIVRMGNGTEVDVVTLDEQNTDLRLPQGTVQLRLRPQDDDENIANVVTTPRGDVTLTAPGRYLIAAGDEDQPTIVTVYEGQAALTDAAGATFDIAAGQAGVLSGDSNRPTFGTRAAQADPLDDWAQKREAKLVAAPPLPRDVSPAMTGVATLGAYGDWDQAPEYGPVWYPRGVSATWQPYREGHWAYIRPWGWTWIDNAPWGFAPFHYGRWIRIHDRWAWAPGAAPARGGVFVRPVYAPALVVFAGLSVAVGGGGPAVAWYPLGWNEPYVPSYHVSRNYIERVNVRVVQQTRIVQVTNVYNRIYVRGGTNPNFDAYAKFNVVANRDHAVAVPRNAFQSARPVAQAAFKPQAAQLKPTVRPAAVTPPKVAPRPALNKAEPPKLKILPVTKRAPIPQKLMMPKPAPAKRPIPAATVRPPMANKPGPQPEPGLGKPGAKPEAKPAVIKPGSRPEPPKAETKPVISKPEAKRATPPKPEARPATVKPEAKPIPVRPEANPQAKPDVPPKTEAKPVTGKPDAKPKPVESKPANIREERKLEREKKPEKKESPKQPPPATGNQGAAHRPSHEARKAPKEHGPVRAEAAKRPVHPAAHAKKAKPTDKPDDKTK